MPLISFNAFNLVPHFVAVIIACLVALPIGSNLERGDRGEGLRTNPLLGILSRGFIQVAETTTARDPEAMAWVVTGVIIALGFIGGSAFLRLSESVNGIVTAASLWTTGVMGTAIDLGSYDVALVLWLFPIGTLWVLSPLKLPATEKAGTAASRALRRTSEQP